MLQNVINNENVFEIVLIDIIVYNCRVKAATLANVAVYKLLHGQSAVKVSRRIIFFYYCHLSDHHQDRLQYAQIKYCAEHFELSNI